MRKVVQSYPGVNMDATGPIHVFDEPRCLFHYREELRAHAESSEDPDAKAHVLFCLDYMLRALRKEIVAYDSLMKNDTIDPGIAFDTLWMAYRPGSLIFTSIGGVKRVLKLISITLTVDGDDNDTLPSWLLDLEGIACDGTDFGYVKYGGCVLHYDGYKALADQEFIPLQYRKDHEKIRKELIERGKAYVSLVGVHHIMYEGVADRLR